LACPKRSPQAANPPPLWRGVLVPCAWQVNAPGLPFLFPRRKSFNPVPSGPNERGARRWRAPLLRAATDQGGAPIARISLDGEMLRPSAQINNGENRVPTGLVTSRLRRASAPLPRTAWGLGLPVALEQVGAAA